MGPIRALVTGAGGFVGGHLVDRLLREGATMRAVDIKPVGEWYQVHPDAENRAADLRLRDACADAVTGVEHVYNLACDMGGMGFVASHHLDCMLSSLISTHMLVAASDARVERFFFSSTACVYPVSRQDEPDVAPLREDDVYPAMPQDGYGWEKLFAERMAAHFDAETGLATRVGRYHNVYGPHGAIDGGREKAPAAICRKVAIARIRGDDAIEIWGDGQQTRSFTYVDDCIEGTRRIMDSSIAEPLNVGSSEMVTVNGLVDVVEEIAGVRLARRYAPEAPQGVRGRNSDNTQIRARLGWEPTTPLRDGLEVTYRWVFDQVARRA